jgi:hypothetical protein
MQIKVYESGLICRAKDTEIFERNGKFIVEVIDIFVIQNPIVGI